MHNTDPPVLELDGASLTLPQLRTFEAQRVRVVLAASARTKMQRSIDVVREAVRTDRLSYGITTGFGAFANKRISSDQLRQLQLNLLRSHTTGIGSPLAAPLVRRMLLLKANSLAAGYSGIRHEVVEGLLSLLNSDVLPIIPERGSVGASGDLAPLAHLSLCLIGEGEATLDGRTLEGTAVCEAAGFAPLTLEAKEGLALINGTQLSLALALDGLFRAESLLDAAVVVGALTVDGLAGSYTPFDKRIHEASRLPHQVEIARRFGILLTESAIHSGHENCDRVQDPYAVRCMPQVLGAVEAALDHGRSVLAAAINGVSDNPLIFDNDILSGGNFHAEPLAMLSDYLAIGVCEIASMSERRTDLLDRRVNPALNMFLTTEPGLESGFMIAHVAAAALTSENRTLAHPASVDNVTTSAGQEDHVSMAPWAGYKLRRICTNTAHVLAIELLAAAHAIDMLKPLQTTQPLQQVHGFVRRFVEHRPYDHRLDRDIAALAQLIESAELGRFLEGDRPLGPRL
ncbi:histidine ammonia-lyase [Povalibacter sp.]|uniref:histidine ammonia-lyase n=1 Tax=Povalibacter sp. TaxID=1962978 RepID=UPI002F3E7474